MPELIRCYSVADSPAVLDSALARLRAGRPVVLPTEAGYHMAVAGEAEAAAWALQGLDSNPLVAVRGEAEARDWAPGLHPAARRLAKRFWPGPLVLACPDGITAGGVASRLAPPVRDTLLADGALQMWSPAQPLLQTLQSHLASPLLLAPIADTQQNATAADAAAALRGVGERADLVIDAGPCGPAAPSTVVRVLPDSWDVIRPGVYAEEQLRRESACLIIFVCTGNTCRSPLAEALCKKRLADRLGCSVAELPERGFFVLSAGLAAMMGAEAAAEAVEVAQSYGADLKEHRSRPLTPQLAAQADYLLAMTASHLQALNAHYRRLGTPPCLLNPAGADLPDPIGCDRSVYEQCGRQIWQDLEPLIDRLQPASAAPANGTSAEHAQVQT